MKYLLLAGLLFPVFLAAQDCKVIRDIDPYTKETKLSSGFISLPDGQVSVEADGKEVDFFFIINDKCFNDESTVIINFEGSKAKTTWHNAGSMNCTGYFHFKYRNSTVTPTVVKKMGTQKITQFIFTGTDKKPLTIELSPEQQEQLMKAVACMSEEAKTLIKN